MNVDQNYPSCSGQDTAVAEETAVESRLSITPDGMALILNCPDPGDDLGPLVDSLLEEMAMLGIQEPPAREDLEPLVRNNYHEGFEIRNLVLLRGTPAGKSSDGYFLWSDDYFVSGFAVDNETDAIDYWNRLDNLAVTKDQVLALIVPPHQGQPGVDVRGKTLKPAKAYRALILAGENVHVVEDGGCRVLRATIGGRLRWADDTVSVDNTYVIKGDVGIETGHIKHEGALVIEGDIKTGAVVQADGDIMVQGAVEPANITAGGSLSVEGGLVGSEEYRIKADGGVNAKFILDAHIDAGGDIVVAREITHSQLRTRGRVLTPKGRIIGGQLMALQGITAGQTGSPRHTKTLLVTGRDYTLADRQEERLATIMLLERRLKQLKIKGQQMRNRLKQLSDRDKQTLRDMKLEYQTLNQHLDQEREALEALEHHSRKLTDSIISVNESIHPETVFQIKDAQKRVTKQLEKPRQVARTNGEISIVFQVKAKITY
ncbi:MAG: FapA family protein [bacterium]